MLERWPGRLYLGVDIPAGYIRLAQSALTARVKLELPVPACSMTGIGVGSTDVHLSDPEDHAFIETYSISRKF